MTTFQDVSPRCTVWLFKTIDRHTIDGQTAVSTRYGGKDPYIDLTPFLGDGSSVHTSKNVREPAGGFQISFTDQAQKDWISNFLPPGFQAVESIYGLVEPMDVIEIRMWGGRGPHPSPLPIVMRGFVSEISRGQTMTSEGKPQRTVTISGQDYGKIWQTYQILYLPAYAQGKPLLTNFALYEMFGVGVTTAMKSGEYVRTMVEKIINPHLAEMLPDTLPSDIPKKIQTGESISVKHGVVNMSMQNQQGSLYDIMKFHGDVGVWNELYTEDRNDGVHCVYRAIPALHLTAPKGKSRKIQDDAPDPVYCRIADFDIEALSNRRSDYNVSNFYWVNNSRFDLIDDFSRKLFGINDQQSTVSLKEYPNTAVKFYGVRPMYASTQQGEDTIRNMGSGQPTGEQDTRSGKQEEWINYRRRTMMEMNRDNVVLEHGSATVKGGPMRPDGEEMMKAGDYARFSIGRITWDAYVVAVDHEFIPYMGYTTRLTYERGEGFAQRTAMESDSSSPYLAEQSSRRLISEV